MKSALTDACTLKLENFEGPFDLLFYLIEKNQIDIYDIPILEITEQYLDYLSAMQELDLDIASEFLVMAATLLHIKSRMLLPKREPLVEEEMVDPREELIIKLLEYKKYKECSKMLADREKKWSGAHFKLPEVIPDIVAQEELEVSPETLRMCMMSALRKYRDKMDDVSKKMKRILNQEKVSLRSKVKEILGFLKNGVRLCFSKLYNHKEKSRLEVATGFLAALEVVRTGQASIHQHVDFGEIYLTPNEKNKNDKNPVSLIEDE
ncbi:MAG TPA: segregation/condensation protein A [Clostridiaceae bacterium]|jgi:segregation and condensation protein A|nr:segregation/condensation protein A [Clostridiaceae bacterium]